MHMYSIFEKGKHHVLNITPINGAIYLVHSPFRCDVQNNVRSVSTAFNQCHKVPPVSRSVRSRRNGVAWVL